MTWPIINLFGILAALLLLFFGRKLFWFLVGMAGFLYGSGIISQYFPSLPWLASVLAGTAFGILCAFVAPYFERILVAFAGFIIGSHASLWIFLRLTPPEGGEPWIAYLAGGLLGLFLAWVLLDAALIVLSTLLGALVLIETLPFSWTVNQMAGLAMLVLGLAVQIQGYHPSNRPPSRLKG